MLKTRFLILSVFLIASCATLPKFPVKQVKIVDVRNGICATYSVEIPSSGKPKYTLIAEEPLIKCDGVIALAPVDFKKAENYLLNLRDDYTCKLKE